MFLNLGLLVIYSLALTGLYLKYETTFSLMIIENLINISIFLFAVLGLFILPYHPQFYGINLNGWKHNLVIGLSAGISLALVIWGLRIVLPDYGVEWLRINPQFKWDYLLYPIFVLSQEWVIKGYIQSYFMSVFGKQKKWLAIFVTAFLFSSLHLVVGVHLVAATFVFGIVTGWWYEKTRSILGVSIVHYFLGAAFLYFSYLL